MTEINSGDTAWLLVSTALVLLMTVPGLALFYGGLVGRSNVLATCMQSFVVFCLVSIQWLLVGYTLSFGSDVGGLVGGLSMLGFRGVGADVAPAAAVPHVLFAMYQGAFAIITVALITGAFAERLRFGVFVALGLAWTTLVYDPLAHWVWGGGWLQKLGALDFAGGTVVHISSGVSALVAALVVGKRIGFPSRISKPNSVLFTFIGAGLLWFGWFGFNAGSALAANGLAAMAFASTNTAAAAAGLAWMGLEAWRHGKPTALGAVTGAVAGLVAITPAAGFVPVVAAIPIGAIASVVCFAAVTVLKPKLGYDDSLDVFGVHGIGGLWGALATGIFASSSVNPAGADGLLLGNPGLLGKQAIAAVACAAFAAVLTFVILKAIALVAPLRVDGEDELVGLDVAIHGEVAFDFFGAEYTAVTSMADAHAAAAAASTSAAANA
jgi:Amt family ammonium transporter